MAIDLDALLIKVQNGKTLFGRIEQIIYSYRNKIAGEIDLTAAQKQSLLDIYLNLKIKLKNLFDTLP